MLPEGYHKLYSLKVQSSQFPERSYSLCYNRLGWWREENLVAPLNSLNGVIAYATESDSGNRLRGE